MNRQSTVFVYKGRHNTERGTVTLEAAILLPIFIIAVLTLGFTLKIIFADENLVFSAVDEARAICEEAYNIPAAPLFVGHLENRMLDENRYAESVEIRNFGYLYQQDGIDGLISFRWYAWLKTDLPLNFKKGIKLQETVKCRGFVGRREAGQPLPFDEMEKDTQSSLVWVFPVGGKRYHQKSCTFISSYPVQTVLNGKVRKEYQPCDLCHPEKIKDGGLVYCFSHYGEVYHLESCPTIDKYVVSMERSQAEERCYTPCYKCGGME